MKLVIHIGGYNNMKKVLHINCNYFGNNPVHKIMIQKMRQIKELDNYVYSPVCNKILEGTDSKTIASNCIKKYDRIFFYNKSKKIRKDLIKKLDIESFDIIHAYTLFTDGNVAYEIYKKYNIPYVVAIRNTDVNTFFKYMFQLRKKGIKIMQNAKAIFFLSDSYREQVMNKYIPKKFRSSILKKSYIIPNGINDFWQENTYYNKKNIIVKEERLAKKHLKIVYVGNIDKNKNLITTCKSIQLLKQDGWIVDYIVAGKIKDQRIYNKIKSIIDYRGILKKEELMNIYREADIFVMPSFTETFGISYIEAISQGLPVIYTKGEGFDNQFKEGQVGYSVDPNKPEIIMEKIEIIINTYKKITDRISKNIKKYDWDKICRIYQRIYKKII